MSTRGGNRGKRPIGSTETMAVSRKGSTYTIAQRGVKGRFIQLSEEDIFDLADILDDLCEDIEDHSRETHAP